MYFKIKLNELSTKFDISDEDRKVLEEKLSSFVLRKKALEGLHDLDVIAILSKYKNDVMNEEIRNLLIRESKYVDSTPIDNLGDDISMIH